MTSSSTAASASAAGSGGQEVTASSNTTAAASKSAASGGHRGEYNTDSQSHTRSNGGWLAVNLMKIINNDYHVHDRIKIDVIFNLAIGKIHRTKY